MVAVHADGGACHGTPLVAGRCPGCGIAPDMQSLELRPADPLDAGVISSDAPIVLSPDDADRVAALLEERPGPTEAMRALFGERRPVAGWGHVDDAHFLPGPIECMAHDDEHASDAAPWFWALRADTSEGRLILIVNGDQILGHRPTLAAAQLAAEDALRAIAAEILRAVGS